jgi:D-erythrulose 1-phosphate 3-epimerase
MRLRLGINTCFAVKRWPRPEDWGPIVRERLGLELVQHSLDLVDLQAFDAGVTVETDALRNTCRANGLELASTFTGLAAYSANLLLHPDASARQSARRWYESAIRFTGAVGGIATGGHVGAFSVADWADLQRRRERWEDLRAALAALAESARTAGLEYLLVENLASAREPSTMAMIRELLAPGNREQVAVRLCLDVGHMCVPGTAGVDGDPYAWLRALGPQAPIVQLQQSDADGDHHWPFTPEMNRRGRIDAGRTIDALADAAVESADLVLEVIPPFEQEDASVLDDLVASVAYWRDALASRRVTDG